MTAFAAKNVVVTGAANGIGRLLARKLAERAAHVILWDIDDANLKSLAQELREKGGRVSSYHCDVSDRQAVYDTARRVVAKAGPVDVLINNAGVVSGKLLHEASDAEIDHTFDVNTLALFWTTRAFLPEMMERNSGHIVTIASAGGYVGTAKLSDYCASKFAAIGFDESLRHELRQQKLALRTTVVCPFYVDTGMFAGVKTRFRWLLPILDADYVAERTIDAIAKNRQRVIMPRFAYVALPLKVLPPRIFDAIVGFFGIPRAMEGFRGRIGREEPRAAVPAAATVEAASHLDRQVGHPEQDQPVSDRDQRE